MVLDILLMNFILLCRILTSATLLVAGVAKMRNGRSRFVQAIMGYELVPQSIATVLARHLPWLEVLSGAMLLVGFLSQVAALIAFGLFLLFNGVIVASILRGKDNDCGCFGKMSPVQWRLVYRNVFLMGLLLPVFAFSGGALALDKTLKLSLPHADVTIVLFVIWGAFITGVVLLQGLIRLGFVHKGEINL